MPEELFCHIRGVGIGHVDILLGDLAGLVVHNTHRAGVETVQAVDIAEEGEIAYLQGLFQLQPEHLEFFLAGIFQQAQVGAEDLHRVARDDLFEYQVPALDFVRAKLLFDLPGDDSPHAAVIFQKAFQILSGNRFHSGIQFLHGLVKHRAKHSGIQRFVHFVCSLKALHPGIVKLRGAVQIVLHSRYREPETRIVHGCNILFRLLNGRFRNGLPDGGLESVLADVEIVEHLQLPYVAALLAAAAEFRACVVQQPDIARPLYEAIEVVCPHRILILIRW